MYRDKTRPSAVSPAMATPIWSSTLKIFFWWEESSELALLTHARTTWVLDRSPIAADPCFTASIAYSTWNNRPAGLHVVTSVSYWFLNIFSSFHSLIFDLMWWCLVFLVWEYIGGLLFSFWTSQEAMSWGWAESMNRGRVLAAFWWARGFDPETKSWVSGIGGPVWVQCEYKNHWAHWKTGL